MSERLLPNGEKLPVLKMGFRGGKMVLDMTIVARLSDGTRLRGGDLSEPDGIARSLEVGQGHMDDMENLPGGVVTAELPLEVKYKQERRRKKRRRCGRAKP